MSHNVLDIGKVASLSRFVWDFPSFITESPMSWGIEQPQANQGGYLKL